MNTQSLLNESAGYNKVMSKEAKTLVAKWEKTGLLEGIESDFERSSIATLLENQARELVKEASSTLIISSWSFSPDLMPINL